MALPDFFVAGAPKAGSTALHAALARHPSLFMCAVKEPKFFLTDGPPPDKGGPGDARTYREHVWRRADYEALFAPGTAGQLRGESTPFYLYDRPAQARIKALLPDAKLIAILRDPIERAHSNWAHLWSAGLDPVDDFVRACAEEPRRIEAGWADFWHYTALGRYGEQLEHLYQLFPREQVHVFRYRTLLERPAEVLDGICGFLGVPRGVVTEVPRENVTAHPALTLRHRASAAGRHRRPPAARPGRGGRGGRAGAAASAGRSAAAAADLGAAPGADPRVRGGHPAAGADHRGELRRLAGAAGRLRRPGRGPAVRPVPGPQRPAAGLLTGLAVTGPAG